MQKPIGRGWMPGTGSKAPESVPELPADAYWMLEVGSRKEAFRAVKAVLKAHRNLERFRLSSREPTATGRALPETTTLLCDVGQLVARLADVPRMAITRLYLDPRFDPTKYGLAEEARRQGLNYDHMSRVIGDAIYAIVDDLTDGRLRD